MAHAVLGGPSDDGRSNYQVALTVCPECERGAQLANGELVPVSPEIVTMAECDAQQLGETLPVANDAHVGSSVDTSPGAHVGAAPARAKQAIVRARRRAASERAGGRRTCCGKHWASSPPHETLTPPGQAMSAPLRSRSCAAYSATQSLGDEALITACMSRT